MGENDDIELHGHERSDEPEPSNVRVVLTREALEQMWEHARSDTSKEVGGLLLGQVARSGDAVLVIVEHALVAEHTDATQGHVTFTHETWRDWYERIDRDFPDKQIVGWYHTHPGFGIFLSQFDTFIQDNFFTKPWHVAVVIDPQRQQIGCFVRQAGQLARVDTEGEVFAPLGQQPEARAGAGEEPQGDEAGPEQAPPPGPATAMAAHQPARSAWFAWGVALALFVLLFMLAYQMGLQGAQWRQQLEALRAEIASLRQDVAAVKVLVKPSYGQWRELSRGETVSEVVRRHYGRDGRIEMAVRVLNGAVERRPERLWLPAPEALLPAIEKPPASERAGAEEAAPQAAEGKQAEQAEAAEPEQSGEETERGEVGVKPVPIPPAEGAGP